jgi:uncharacterized protein
VFRLRRMMGVAAKANGPGATSIQETFRPLPLLGNPHVQTLLGYFWEGTVAPGATREVVVPLPDGDRIVLHDSLPPGWQRGGPMALLVHGLGGSHRSGPVRRVAGLLWRRGVRAVRIDLRGSGRGAGFSRRLYNAACSSDVRAALMEMHAWDTSAPIALVGFSLGGNIALKLAGEAAAQPVSGLQSVAAVAPPVDLERCAALISARWNRFYEMHFVQALVGQVRALERRRSDLRRTRFPSPLSLRRFDDLYTAPLGGYADALDYYRRASSLPLIPAIRIPTLILTARDDPFIAVEPIEKLAAVSYLTVRIFERGGHLGFLGPDGAGGIRWAERRLTEWVLQNQ